MDPDKPFNYWQNDQSSDNTTISPPVPFDGAQGLQPAVSSQQSSNGTSNPQTVSVTINHESIVAQPVVPAPPSQPTPMPQTAPQPPVQPSPTPESFDVVANHEPVELTHDLRPQTPEPMPMYTPSPEPADDSQVPQPEAPVNQQSAVVDDDNTIHWSATEYAYRQKNGMWFAIFAIVVLGLIALDIFLLKTYTFSALVAVMSAAIIVFYKRPPQEITYTLSPDHGLYVGEVLHTFDEFKSFAVINDSGNNFVMLIPVKRFSTGLSVYFPNEFGEQIVDVLGERLPMEDKKLDAFDVIVRKLRI